MDRENYFILLELSFDPVETDPAKIADAISKKQHQWTKDQINPMRKVKGGKYLGMLDDIKKVLNDPVLRDKEAKAAKDIMQEKLGELDKKIKVSSAKGFVKPTEIKQWVKAFGAYGITEDVIKKRLKVSISDKAPQKKEEKFDVIDASTARNIDTQLKSLGLNKNNGNLYTFMNMPQNSQPAALVEEAERKKKMLLAKGEKTQEDNARQALYGICAIVFKDKISKKKYDEYVRLTKYGDINELIDDAARGNNKILDSNTYEFLVDTAIKSKNIGFSNASTYIKQYCKLKGFVVEGGIKVICGFCNTENPAGLKTCSKCGKPLIIICPKCKEENGNTAKKCSGCGFDLIHMNDALPIIDKARKAVNEKHIADAKKLLQEANILWPSHPDIVSIQKHIAEREKHFNDLMVEISECINNKNMYAAQLKINQAKNEGFNVDTSITDRVNSLIKQVESDIAKAKTLSDNEAFEIITSAADRIHDSNEVNELKKKYPPAEPKNVNTIIKNTAVDISWTKTDSVGKCQYIVVRNKDSYPNSPENGEILYKGADTHYTDDTLAISTEYYYAVFTERLNIVSKPARCSDAVVIVNPVMNVKAIGGDGLITLSWNKPKTVTEIKLWKYKGTDRPVSINDCESVVCNRLDGFVINGLTNRERYWFGIQAVHNINGKIIDAEVVFINAVPQKPAEPLEDFSVFGKNGVYKASWKKSEWDVVLLRSSEKPDYAVGVIYDFNDISQKYEKIDINLKSITEAEFVMNFIGECYIIPCVINASNAILNDAVYLSSVDSVSDVTGDSNSAGTELYINFKWPKGINKVVMVYRMDTYPTGLDDTIANRIECTKKQYESNDALLIANPAQGVYYAIIYAVFETKNKKVYSNGVKALINNEPQRDVFYDLKYKKGLFSSKRTLTVNVSSKGHFMLPQFVIVSKSRSVPLDRSDGDVICSVSEETEIDGSHVFNFEVQDLPKGIFLKMFFINKNQYKRYKLLNNSSSKI